MPGFKIPLCLRRTKILWISGLLICSLLICPCQQLPHSIGKCISSIYINWVLNKWVFFDKFQKINTSIFASMSIKVDYCIRTHVPLEVPRCSRNGSSVHAMVEPLLKLWFWATTKKWGRLGRLTFKFVIHVFVFWRWKFRGVSFTMVPILIWYVVLDNGLRRHVGI